VSNRTVAALPAHYRVRRAFTVDKPSLKARSAEAMRAATRRALDALRHGADPEALTMPARSRDVADRWAFD
jgi:hypothetical protein